MLQRRSLRSSLGNRLQSTARGRGSSHRRPAGPSQQASRYRKKPCHPVFQPVYRAHSFDAPDMPSCVTSRKLLLVAYQRQEAWGALKNRPLRVKWDQSPRHFAQSHADVWCCVVAQPASDGDGYEPCLKAIDKYRQQGSPTMTIAYRVNR